MEDSANVAVGFREFVFALASIVDSAHDDPASLDRLLRLAERSLQASGMTLTEVVAGDDPQGRIVGATGVCAWALGRPASARMMRAVMLRQPPPYRVELEVLDQIDLDQLRAAGVGWMLVHPVHIQDHATVLLTAYLSPEQVVDPDQTAVTKLCAASIGHAYRAGATVSTARAADDDRDLFMAVTSHELRTPVTVIKGYAETLRDHWDQLTDEQRRQAARVIGQRAADLARMVDRLLDATTITGTRIVQPINFDLLDTLRKASADLSAPLRKRLQVALPERLPPAKGHRASIASVLTELVTNAHKYSPGPAPIILTADFDRCTVLFRIADRGIGIPAHQIAQTFDRFWQGETGDDRRYGGAGLGLFLVRKTIERQNGWVSLRPRDGGGTVAEVRLPRGDM